MPSPTEHRRQEYPAPHGGFYRLDCTCGRQFKSPHFNGTVGLPRDRAQAALEKMFRDHLQPHERRTYLLCDTRRPSDWRTVAQILEAAADTGDRMTPAQAERLFHAQPPIIGTFVMPEGLPVRLIASRREDGLHYGRYQVEDEEPAELPIREVRTPQGRIFRAE